MFKKERDLAERSKTLLKNKDVRNLKAEIIRQFPRVSDEELNTVIPNKANISLTKLANKTSLYSLDNIVLFFDVGGRNNLFPSLPFLWRFPHAMKCFVVFSPVSEFVLKGADLMAPGLCPAYLSTLEGLKIGDKVCICVLGNPLPFAVGESLVDWEKTIQPSISIGQRPKGRALSVLHVFGDYLMGGVHGSAGAAPNSGFGVSRIYPVEGVDGEEDEDGGDEDEEADEGADGDHENEANPRNVNDVANGKVSNEENEDEEGVVQEEEGRDGGRIDREEASVEPREKTLEVDDGPNTNTNTNTNTEKEEEEDDNNEKEEKEDGDNDDDGDGGEEEVALQGTEVCLRDEQDTALLRAVLLATKYIIKDKQLPMLVSTYWTLLQRCTTAAATSSTADEGLSSSAVTKLDIKRSSYRKVSSFLRHCQNKWELLTFQDENGVATVTGLNRSNDMFGGAKVEDPAMFKAQVTSAAEPSSSQQMPSGSSLSTGISSLSLLRPNDGTLSSSSASSSGTGGGVGAARGSSNKVQIIELFKITKPLRAIFGAPRGEFGEHLRPSEVRDILQMYLHSKQLQHPADKSSLRVPPSDALHQLVAPYSSASACNSSTMSKKKLQQQQHQLQQKEKKKLLQDTAAIGNKQQNEREEPAVYDPYMRYNAAEEGEEEYDGGNPTLLQSTSSELWNKPLQLKVHSGGLKSVDNYTPAEAAAIATSSSGRGGGGGGGGGGINETFPPAPPASASKSSDGRRALGGWGVGTGSGGSSGGAWKPVSLSTARATAHLSQHSNRSSSRSSSSVSEKEFPTLGAAKPSTSQASGSGSGSAKQTAVVYSELPVDVHIRKEDVFKGIMAKMSPYFAVIAPNGITTFHSGQIPKAKIIVETRMGNKAVTILRNLEVFGLDLPALSKDAQKKFACSVALSSVPGIPKDKDIVIQGNMAYEAESYLTNQWGVPQHLLDINASKGKKKK